jgi:predicted dehydrogenase
MREELRRQYDNPYPCETAIFRLEGDEIAAEATRTLFHTARAYTESFSVYGDRASFEWQQLEKTEDPVVFRMGGKAEGRGRENSAERVAPPDRADLLPPEIARFTRRGVYDEKNPHLSFLQGGGHHGSHPHMVHEFVRAVVEDREPRSGAVVAANWTAAGICAHQSAMNGGELVEIPAFD